MIPWGAPYGDLPAQIWGFLDLTGMEEGTQHQLPGGIAGGCQLSRGVWAIVQSTDYVEEEEGGDVEKDEDGLFKEVVLEAEDKDEDGTVKKRKFYLVDVESFKDPLVVIPNQGTRDRYLLMAPRSTWSNMFIAWLQYPHKWDDASEE